MKRRYHERRWPKLEASLRKEWLALKQTVLRCQKMHPNADRRELEIRCGKQFGGLDHILNNKSGATHV